MTMTYTLDIELNDPLEAVIDGILSEVEEAVDYIRMYKLKRVMHQEEVDIHELLADHRAIGIVWDIQHVMDQRPDLGDKQAWEVLQECQQCFTSLRDAMRETILDAADKLYPRKRQARPTKAGHIIADYDPNGDERRNLVDLLTDLIHWCEGFGEPFDEFCGSARIHFAEESESYKKGA
jgi:hypothetical protein